MADEGDAIPKIDDGIWPAFPADLTSIATAVATQTHGTVMIFEKMFENRLFFVDKLVAMGARIVLCDPHRAVVSGPVAALRRAPGEPGHPRRHGDADREPGRARGPARSATSARSTAATSASTSACRTLGADIERVRELSGRPRRRAGGAAPPGAQGRAAGRGRRAARRSRRAVRGRFAAFGYREVMTPVLEFADGASTARRRAGCGDAFRLFDDAGRVLVLRPDLTIPVAAPGRHPDGRPPRARCASPTSRAPSGRRRPGRPRAAEQRQAGVELVGRRRPGAPTPRCSALLVERPARRRAAPTSRVGVGDVSLTAGGARRRCGVPRQARGPRCGAALAARNFVGVAAARARGPRRGPRRGAAGRAARRCAAGPSCWSGSRATVPAAGGGLRAAAARCSTCSARTARADAVLLDLGVLRDWPYYSGIVFEAYAPGVGRAGGHGRALRRPRRRASAGPRPAVGFAHRARPAAPRRCWQAGAPAGPPARRRGAGGRPRRATSRPRAAGARGRAPGGRAAGRRPRRRRRSPPPTAGATWRARRRRRLRRARPAAAGERLACARLEEVLPSPA